FALAAQGKNAFNFVQGEAEGLRLFDKAELFESRLVVNAVASRGSFRGRQEPAPFVEANGVGLDAGQLCKLSNEQGLAHARARRFAWASLMRPSKTISPSTTTVGMARIPYRLAGSQHSCPEQRRSMTSQPQADTAFLTSLSVCWQSGQPAVNISINLFFIFV